MDTDSIFIKDIESIRAFIQLEKQKDDYFNHVMDRIMAKASRKHA